MSSCLESIFANCFGENNQNSVSENVKNDEKIANLDKENFAKEFFVILCQIF